MINLNKLLIGSVLVAAVFVQAEETTKVEVEKSNIYTEVKKFVKEATSQENIDIVTDCTSNAFEQTKKVFTQYPMYVPAAFFLGRASMADKIAHIESAPKELLKKMRRTKTRNMYVGGVLSALHVYYNHNEKAKETEA